MRLSTAQWEELVAVANEAAPDECWGYLRVDDDVVREITRGVGRLGEVKLRRGDSETAIYHSHPGGGSGVPSAADIEIASSFRGLLLLSDRGDGPEVHAWRIADGKAEEDELVVVDRRVGRVPGFAADTTTGLDLLGIAPRVEFLSSVLASRQLETPLAIGLFGDWGSGKSFFMRCLQERIDMLAERSAEGEEAGRDSFYCSHISQVTFNPWLYSDSDMWSSFAAHVFRSITGAERDVPQGELQAGHLGAYQNQLRALTDRRGEVAVAESSVQQDIDEVRTQIAEKRARADGLAGGLGTEAGALARVLAGVREIFARLGRIVRGRRQLTFSDAAVIALPVAAAVAGVALGWGWVTAALAVAVSVVGIAVAAVRYVDDSMRLRSEIRELEDREQELVRARTALAEQKSAAEHALGSAVDLPLLPQFAEGQAARWTDREQLGVVTEVRLAFERLSRLISESLAARAHGDGDEGNTLPIDRVVVYVDDLDRCQPSVVVSVLETIKLLVSLPHFAVIVGVDSRWLFRSLQVHFRSLLRPDGQLARDDHWAATPQNYLEKIFQYSFALRPLHAQGFERLMEGLVPIEDEPIAGVRPAPAGAEVTGPGDADLQRIAAATPPAELDLTPSELRLTRTELRFAMQLAPLFRTPRAAKRFANVYRFIRVSVGEEQLVDRGGYGPVLLLLAISIAYPALAGGVLATLRVPSLHSDLELIQLIKPERIEPGVFRNGVSEDLGTSRFAWDHVAGLLERNGWHFRVEDVSRWVDVVAEFSFHPWQE